MNSLPPEPRLLIEGNAAAATPYVGIARKLAKRAYLSGIRAKTWQVAAGVVVRVENYLESRLSKVYIRSAPAGFPFLAVTWEPEGIVLTPRTEAAPYGYGFPKRDAITGAKINPPFGTLLTEDTEALNQVLINRYPNNKYLDRFEYISGIPEERFTKLKLPETNPRLRDSLAVGIEEGRLKVVYWPLHYEPTAIDDPFWTLSENRINWPDVPGTNRWTGGYNFKTFPPPETDEGELVGDLPNRQFDDVRDSLIFETETEQWYCHWPEELLYDNDAFEAIFQETNRYRSLVGREPLHRELRGYANMGRMILSEMQRARVMFHDNEELYRPGYGTVFYRGLNAAVTFSGIAENLLTGPSSGTFSWDFGVEVALGWRNSPLHYANMIEESWKTSTTSLDVFGNSSVSITEKGSIAGQNSILDQVFDPPLSGRAWSQLFIERANWLYTGNIEHRTQYGIVTTNSFLSPIGIRYFSAGAGYFINFKGRSIFVKYIYDIEQEKNVISVNLGSCVYMENNILKYRVIFGYFKNLIFTVSACNRPVHGEHLDWVGEGNLDIAERMGYFSYECFHFSLDGMTAISTTMEHLVDHQFSWYFTDLPEGSPKVCPAGKRVIHYNNGVFSFGDIIVGPNVTYTLTVYDEDTYKYNYRQNGEGTVNISPYINESGTLSYIQYEMSHLIYQEWTGENTYETTIQVNDTLVFDSGKRLKIRKINLFGDGDNSNTGQYSVVGFGEEPADAYFITFFYFNPVTEDIVYAKHNLSISNGAVVQTDIYVNDVLVKQYQAIQTNSAYYTRVRPVQRSSTSLGYFADGAIDTVEFLAYSPYLANIALPVPFWFGGQGGVAGGYDHFFCTDRPSERAYIGKTRIGTYPVSIMPCYGYSRFCYNVGIGDERFIEAGYGIGIPYITLAGSLAEGACFFSRYKDRIVARIEVVNLWGISSSNTSQDDRKIIYSNFLLEDEVGIGSLSEILPMGVIYG